MAERLPGYPDLRYVSVAGLSRLPFSLRVLAENLLRHNEDAAPLREGGGRRLPGGQCRLVVHGRSGLAEFALTSAVLTAAETGWVLAGGLLPGILARTGFAHSP